MANNPLTTAGDSAKFDESGDNDDLQALFDSIATGVTPAVEMAATQQVAGIGQVSDAFGDNPELQSLFDSVSAEVGVGASRPEPVSEQTNMPPTAAPLEPAILGDPTQSRDERAAYVFKCIGHMARQLHDAMHELGYDKVLEESARAIPDARQRLNYIAQMNEQAASRVLNATEILRPVCHALEERSASLATRWDQVFANQMSPADFKSLAADTHSFLHLTPGQINAANNQITEIMMAQDFQDLTGQVIKKLSEVAQKMERQLLAILVETMPEHMRAEIKSERANELLNGPAIDSEGRSDIVHSQAQVDELLESLGF